MRATLGSLRLSPLQPAHVESCPLEISLLVFASFDRNFPGLTALEGKDRISSLIPELSGTPDGITVHECWTYGDSREILGRFAGGRGCTRPLSPSGQVSLLGGEGPLCPVHATCVV